MKLHRIAQFTVASICTIALSVSVTGIANAANLSNSLNAIHITSLSELDKDVTPTEPITLTEAQAVEFAAKIAQANPVLKSSITAPGKFSIAATDAELQDKHHFTSDEVKLLHSFASGQAPAINIIERTSTSSSDRAARLFHISNADLQAGTFAFLATAAEAGPAAVAAVWPLLTSLAGPLGTVAGIATAVLGGQFFANIAAKVVGALHQGKGITFYSDWAIPPITVEIEGE
ncbi:hypothetical protein [Arcanobacterium hippocoleae]|uniref:hypothetical protein n=1 Tax=Arcanobacterium hippocoleae TaxID=149017 RepID=UPI00333FD41F